MLKPEVQTDWLPTLLSSLITDSTISLIVFPRATYGSVIFSKSSYSLKAGKIRGVFCHLVVIYCTKLSKHCKTFRIRFRVAVPTTSWGYGNWGRTRQREDQWVD